MASASHVFSFVIPAFAGMTNEKASYAITFPATASPLTVSACAGTPYSRPAAILAVILRERDVEPKWLAWAREIQAIAQTGLAYARDVYDRQRYEKLQALAARIMAESSDMDYEVIREL